MKPVAIFAAAVAVCILLFVGWRYMKKSKHPAAVKVVRSVKSAQKSAERALSKIAGPVKPQKSAEAVGGTKFGRHRLR